MDEALSQLPPVYNGLRLSTADEAPPMESYLGLPDLDERRVPYWRSSLSGPDDGAWSGDAGHGLKTVPSSASVWNITPVQL